MPLGLATRSSCPSCGATVIAAKAYDVWRYWPPCWPFQSRWSCARLRRVQTARPQDLHIKHSKKLHIFTFSPELCFSLPFYSLDCCWTFNARKSSNSAINQKRGLHKQPVMTRVLNWNSLKRCGYMWSRLFKMNVRCLARIYEKSLCRMRSKRVFNQLWTETVASIIELYSYTANWFFWWGIMNKLGPEVIKYLLWM